MNEKSFLLTILFDVGLQLFKDQELANYTKKKRGRNLTSFANCVGQGRYVLAM